MLEITALVFMSLLISFLLWALYCNEKTYTHRISFLSSLYDSMPPDYSAMRRYRSISRNTHLFRLMTFRWNWEEWYNEPEKRSL